ncbi:PepSY-associated TM helix domain-containing protein [Caldalkalibacillus salinus]|uniref:PepSY-associated TM helix domain-containing protein n=1 Tax=Caldalkalibacillus salinus TaxID=2803787 RepID=UPI0019227995|nr:PepSY domain-containing protein [Caldalkalibacillus salinus]
MSKTQSGTLYATIWRWHFYAGLLIAPFIFLLTLSGAFYLFKPQIENYMYDQFYQVEDTGDRIPPSEQIDTVLDRYPDATVTGYRPGEESTRSAEVQVMRDHEATTVFVNPYNGDIIGELPQSDRLFEYVSSFHSEFMLGTFGDRLVELTACWTLVLILTGLYLWYPRGQKNKIFGVLIPRLKKNKNILMRDLHVVPGVWVSAGLTFLIITGLLWTGFWGANVQSIATNSGTGYPPSVWVGNAPSTTVQTKDIADVRWAAQNLPVPTSDIQGYIPVSIDDIVETANDIGVHPTYEVILPTSTDGVYTLSAFPPKAKDEATIHIDQYTGAILADYRYDHYEPIGKLMAWGITVHKGLEYGLANQIVLFILCLGVIAAIIFGIVLWWNRKPDHHIGAPKIPQGKTAKGFIVLMLIMGIVFPLVGLSLIIIFLLDWFVIRKVTKIKTFFNS